MALTPALPRTEAAAPPPPEAREVIAKGLNCPTALTTEE